MQCIPGGGSQQSVSEGPLTFAAEVTSASDAAGSAAMPDNHGQQAVAHDLQGSAGPSGHSQGDGANPPASGHALGSDNWQGSCEQFDPPRARQHSRSFRSAHSQSDAASCQPALNGQHLTGSGWDVDPDHATGNGWDHSQRRSDARQGIQSFSQPAAVTAGARSPAAVTHTGTGWDVHSPASCDLDTPGAWLPAQHGNDGVKALDSHSPCACAAEDYAWAQGDPELDMPARWQQQQQWTTDGGMPDTAAAQPASAQSAVHSTRHQSSQRSSQSSLRSSQRSSQSGHQSSQRSSQSSHLPSHAVRQQSSHPPAGNQPKQQYRRNPEVQAEIPVAGALEEESSTASVSTAHHAARTLSEVNKTPDKRVLIPVLAFCKQRQRSLLLAFWLSCECFEPDQGQLTTLTSVVSDLLQSLCYQHLLFSN